MTKLPNRTLFGELLQRAIAQGARASQPQYAVLFIDLDGFKLVNDSLGHIIGDRFLIAIAQRLQAQLGRATRWHASAATSSPCSQGTSQRRKTSARSPSVC